MHLLLIPLAVALGQPHPQAARPGELIEERFFSDALGKEVPYCLWLPGRPHGSSSRLPVLIVLHGRGRHHRSLVEEEKGLTHLKEVPFAVAFPRGEDGWWIDSPVLPESRYQSMILEFIRHVEDRYPVGGSLERRAVTGWSMGGYGAVRLGQDHPDWFDSVSSMIGLLDLPRGPGYTPPTRIFGERGDNWETLTPSCRAADLRGKKLAVFTCESGFDRQQNEIFHEALDKAEIPHLYRMVKGDHHITTVLTLWPKVLTFHEEAWREVDK